MVDVKENLREELKSKRASVDDPFTPTAIGEYSLKKLLGKGSFGNVYLATNKLGQLIAIKEIHSETDSKSLQRIHNEISILKAIKHPNVINLYEVIQDSSDRFFLVMEYCTGGDLLQYLKRKRTLHEFEVQEIVYQVARGLEALYKQNIMHRDIKLQNLLISKEGEKITIKIADFGLARYTTGYASTYCGTLPYMAPEVIQGYSYIDKSRLKYSTKAELWSLGITIYILLSGRLLLKPTPLTFTDAANTNKDIECRLDKLGVTNECKDLLKKLLVLDYKQRMDKIEFFSHPFVKTTPENYKNRITIEADKTLLKHINHDKSVDDDISLTSSESETVFYSSHQ